MRHACRAGLLVALLLGLRPPVAADGIMLVRAGAFWMGRDDGAADEGPLHRVHVHDVWIERHKVTNAEFAAFLNVHGARTPAGDRRFDWDDDDARIHGCAVGAPAQGSGARRSGDQCWAADRGFERHPAVEVSWFGARDFCAWRGRRLPTEAEWEKAARGDDQRPYPWGTAAPAPHLANFGRPYNATERGDARPAGASPSGIEDLLGNLREWTASKLRAYPYRTDTESLWDGQHGRVVVRGASHDDGAATLHVAVRRSYDRRGAAAGHHFVGFRCATSEDLGEMAPGRR